MKTLVIIGIERTGTNYLCSLLNQLRQVESRFELFANVAAISLTPQEVILISRLANQPFQDKTDPALIGYLKENIDIVLSAIQQELPKHREIFSFKIFREHLPQSTITHLMRSHAVIFVTRTVIDTYISFMKALQSKVWINRDTTALKPELNINHFTYWYRETQRYYRCCFEQYQVLKQQVPVILNYRDFTRGSDPENLQFIVQNISNITGINIIDSVVEFKSGFQKQDHNEIASQKVSNWGEFERQLQERNLLAQALGSFLEV